MTTQDLQRRLEQGEIIILDGATAMEVGAYPNSTGTATSRWDLQDTESPESLLADAQQWVKMGVQVLGGCCGIGPGHIRAFRECLPARLP